jgi:hypothetical protein
LGMMISGAGVLASIFGGVAARRHLLESMGQDRDPGQKARIALEESTATATLTSLCAGGTSLILFLVFLVLVLLNPAGRKDIY